nr:MAG TPA: Protein of unknown function (DUF1642) [Caudoviricetes sp.]
MNKKQLISIIRTEILLAKSIPERKGYIAGLEEAINIIEGFSDEPQAGHAEEAPRYVRNVIARLRELPLHDREVWLKAIMDEFEEDFCHSIWREGYEQGKFEGAWVGEQLKDADKIRRELNRPVVKQFVADWFEKCKEDLEYNIWDWIKHKDELEKTENMQFIQWLHNCDNEPVKTLVKMKLYGYTVEKEKRYRISMPKARNYNNKVQFLCEKDGKMFWCAECQRFKTKFTQKELEDSNFGWLFNCEGVEVEEVEDDSEI